MRNRLEGNIHTSCAKPPKFSNDVSLFDDYNFQKRINARKKNDPCQTDDEFVALPQCTVAHAKKLKKKKRGKEFV